MILTVWKYQIKKKLNRNELFQGLDTARHPVQSDPDLYDDCNKFCSNHIKSLFFSFVTHVLKLSFFNSKTSKLGILIKFLWKNRNDRFIN